MRNEYHVWRNTIGIHLSAAKINVHLKIRTPTHRNGLVIPSNVRTVMLCNGRTGVDDLHIYRFRLRIGRGRDRNEPFDRFERYPERGGRSEDDSAKAAASLSSLRTFS